MLPIANAIQASVSLDSGWAVVAAVGAGRL